MKNDHWVMKYAIEGLDRHIEKLTAMKQELVAVMAAANKENRAPVKKKRKPRTISAEGKQRMAEAQRRRWERIRSEEAAA